MSMLLMMLMLTVLLMLLILLLFRYMSVDAVAVDALVVEGVVDVIDDAHVDNDVDDYVVADVVRNESEIDASQNQLDEESYQK